MQQHRRIDHDLYRGTLDIVVLSLLNERPDHGYGLIERLRSHSRDMLIVSEGAVYPLLHRMETRQLVESRWAMSRHNRRAKQYLITDRGRGLLRERAAQWNNLAKILDGLLRPLVHVSPEP